MSDAPKVYRFERYRNGQLMAEGIKITKAYTFKQATLSAAKIADAGDVLVFDPPDDADHVNELIAAAYEDAAKVVSRAGHSLDVEIRNRIPDDARAALKRVRREALREAAEMCATDRWDTLEEKAVASYLNHRILALITEGQTNG